MSLSRHKKNLTHPNQNPIAPHVILSTARRFTIANPVHPLVLTCVGCVTTPNKMQFRAGHNSLRGAHLSIHLYTRVHLRTRTNCWSAFPHLFRRRHKKMLRTSRSRRNCELKTISVTNIKFCIHFYYYTESIVSEKIVNMCKSLKKGSCFTEFQVSWMKKLVRLFGKKGAPSTNTS